MCEIINLLNSIDTELFLLLNGLHNSFFDQVAFVISNKWTWIPLYASILYLIIQYWRKESLWLIVALLLSIVLADQIASGILKPMVKRFRPSHVESLQTLIHTVNGYFGGKYGFVSSHAANSFALAMFTALLFKRKTYTWVIFLWAILNSYSRIYLGVHYPFDILGGMIVGLSSALFCFFLLKKFRPEILIKQSDFYDFNTQTKLEKVKFNLPILVLTITVIGILLMAV